MAKKVKAEKIGFQKSGPVTGGYIVNGGLKAVPHNLTLDIRRNKLIYILLIVILGFFAVFNYAPMVGLLMSFQDYAPARGCLLYTSRCV